MMKSSEYWQKRFELLEQAAHQQGVQCYADIEKQYRQAQKTLEGQIAAWYQRFADNNGVTLADAKRMLTAKELAELKWDIQDYIRYGEENAINGTWVKQLENASARFHISRLEALKLQTQQSIEVMFGNQLDSIDSTMRDVYKSGYYRTAFEIQKGVGVGWDFSALDDKQISKVINKPWAVDGKNFSERIWGNRQKLINELNQTLTQNIILGKDPQKAIDELARKMNTSKVNAGRLVMTEEAFFSSAAQKDCFAELDVEMYEIVATLDSHTSDICRGMDGKHFKMSEWKVGETAPPFHVHCRSTTVPYFDDEFDAVGERAARDEETGKTYFVPGNMTYKEWQKSFVDGAGDDSAKADLTEVTPDDTVKVEKVKVPEEPPRVFRELTEEEFKAIKQSITPAERKILYGRSHFSGYINSSNARKMNTMLRNGEPLPADYKDIEMTMKGVIGRYSLPDDLLVTRYVTNDALQGMFGVSVPQYKFGHSVDDFWKEVEALPELLGTDRTYIEKGFLSTSGVASNNVMTDKSIKMLIKAPKGTPSYVTTNYKESEIIFNENTTLHLVNAYIENPRQAGWKIVLECEIR